MSLTTITREIVELSSVVLCNPRLRTKDLIQWSTYHIQPADATQVTIHLPNLPVFATFPTTCDKRSPNPNPTSS